MNSSTRQAAEVFLAAGEAMNKLGVLTSLLPSNGVPIRWSEEDFNRLHAAIIIFAEELNFIISTIRMKSEAQLHATLEKRVYEEAGLPVPQRAEARQQERMLERSLEMTLDMLNALESDGNTRGSHQGI